MRFMFDCLLVLCLVAFGGGVNAQRPDDKIMILGGASRQTYLGCLNCDETEPDSIFNRSGDYGHCAGNKPASENLFCPGRFREPRSAGAAQETSACGSSASTPPAIVDERGTYYGRFAVGGPSAHADAVCSTSASAKFRDPTACEIVKWVCKQTNPSSPDRFSSSSAKTLFGFPMRQTMPQSSREMYDAIVKLRSLLESERRKQAAAASAPKPIEVLPSSAVIHPPVPLPSPPPTTSMPETPQAASPPPVASITGPPPAASPPPATSMPGPPQAAADSRTTSAQPMPVENACRSGWPQHVTVRGPTASVFIQPRVMAVPLSSLPTGTSLNPTQRTGDWFLIKFEDRRWGQRVGYVHCADVTITR